MVLEQQFSTNGAGTTEHPYAKKNEFNLGVPLQNLTQNESQT